MRSRRLKRGRRQGELDEVGEVREVGD